MNLHRHPDGTAVLLAAPPERYLTINSNSHNRAKRRQMMRDFPKHFINAFRRNLRKRVAHAPAATIATTE